MPVYCFAAEDGECLELFMSVAEMQRRSRKDLSIRHAGKTWHRDIAAEHGGFSNVQSKNWPLLSDAAGVVPQAIPKAKRWADQLGVPTEFTRDGQAIFTSAQHRRKFLKAHGMYDRSGYD